MKCCGGIEAKETDLKNVKFDKLILNIEKTKLEFDPDLRNGEFKIIESNANVNMSEEQQLVEQVEKWKEDISKKDTKTLELKKKIKEIDKKLQSMDKILNVDVSEQEYLKDLGEKVKKSSIIS